MDDFSRSGCDVQRTSADSLSLRFWRISALLAVDVRTPSEQLTQKEKIPSSPPTCALNQQLSGFLVSPSGSVLTIERGFGLMEIS